MITTTFLSTYLQKQLKPSNFVCDAVFLMYGVLQTTSVLSFALLLFKAYLCNHCTMQLLQLCLSSFVVGEENHRGKRQFISLLQCEVSPKTTIVCRIS